MVPRNWDENLFSCVLFRFYGIPDMFPEKNVSITSGQTFRPPPPLHLPTTLDPPLKELLPLVLLRKMVATRCFHGSWNKLSWTRLYGDRGGVHCEEVVDLLGFGDGSTTFFRPKYGLFLVVEVVDVEFNVDVPDRAERERVTRWEAFSAFWAVNVQHRK